MHFQNTIFTDRDKRQDNNSASYVWEMVERLVITKSSSGSAVHILKNVQNIKKITKWIGLHQSPIFFNKAFLMQTKYFNSKMKRKKRLCREIKLKISLKQVKLYPKAEQNSE